jgi:hypothetical protein
LGMCKGPVRTRNVQPSDWYRFSSVAKAAVIARLYQQKRLSGSVETTFK